MTDAKTWIGSSSDDDSLDLATITKSLPAEAKDLQAILQDVKVSGLLRIRREASSVAAKAQASFKRWSLAAVVATAVATLTSGLLLYGAGSDPAINEGLVHWVKINHTGIVIVQIVGLFVSGAVTAYLGSRNLVERWTENRNKAELLRREVFNEVLKLAQDKMGATPAAPDHCNPICQALEFFRRYQLELQIAYYRKGWTRHDRAAGILSALTALLAGIAGIAGVIGALGGSALVLSAFLGIAVPILLSAAQSWRATARDNDKAATYETAKNALDQSLIEIEEVRKKAALGDAAAVHAYIDSVHLIMTTESAAWKPAAK